MGADLYIKDMDRDSQCTGFEVSERAVKVGYFRDCYNDYGLFNFIRSNVPSMKDEFSWWQMSSRYKKTWFDKDGDMTVEGAKAFRKLVMRARRIIESKKLYQLLVYDHDAPKTSITDIKMKAIPLNKKDTEGFLSHLNLLVKFLNLAIEKNSPIEWSV
ncbi:MAG: hypothetical protein WC208_10440 [Gallionella sp.]|jgi:hypothetical protein